MTLGQAAGPLRGDWVYVRNAETGALVFEEFGTPSHTEVLDRGDERTNVLRETMSELLALDEPRQRYAAMISGLDIHYDFGPATRCSGMPDLDLVTESGPRRVFTFLRAARPVLRDLGESGTLDVAAWADRVQRVDARYAGIGAPGARHRSRSDRHLDSSRRTCRLDGRRHGPRTSRPKPMTRSRPRSGVDLPGSRFE